MEKQREDSNKDNSCTVLIDHQPKKENQDQKKIHKNTCCTCSTKTLVLIIGLSILIICLIIAAFYIYNLLTVAHVQENPLAPNKDNTNDGTHPIIHKEKQASILEQLENQDSDNQCFCRLVLSGETAKHGEIVKGWDGKECRQEVQYFKNNGSVKVSARGDWHIISTLSIYVPEDEPLTDVDFTHEIAKSSIGFDNGKLRTLQKHSAKKDCSNVEGEICATSTINDVIKLAEGDEITIKTSRTNLLVNDQVSSVWIMYRLNKCLYVKD